MNPEDFKFISELLKKRSGLVLTPDKIYVLESRLVPVARKHELKGLDELIAAVRDPANGALVIDVTEAMTTNESFFFRDTKPFDLFREIVLPQLLENRAAKKSFRVLCAAASSGQEPYSLAMILKEEAAKLQGWRHEIVGTDLSLEILAKAKSGLYSQFEAQRGLPIQMLIKYFDKVAEQWQIKQEIRAMVQYREFNLLDDLTPLGRFDVVFCRNVLIYFDIKTKREILANIRKNMDLEGYMFLGGAETTLNIDAEFHRLRIGKSTCYTLTEKELAEIATSA